MAAKLILPQSADPTDCGIGGLQGDCADGANNLYACSCNGTLYLFDIEPLPNDPLCKDKGEPKKVNPHLLGTSEVTQSVLALPAMIGNALLANYRERLEGAQEEFKRRVTVMGLDPVRVCTGGYAYFEFLGDLIGGQVTAISRDTLIATTLEINTSKAVPFSPTLVELDNWPRKLQE